MCAVSISLKRPRSTEPEIEPDKRQKVTFAADVSETFSQRLEAGEFNNSQPVNKIPEGVGQLTYRKS